MGFFDDLFGPIQLAIEQWLLDTNLTMAPFNTVFLMLISLVVSSISGLATRLVIDMEDMEKKNQQIQTHNQRKKKAKETADKKLWQSVQKKDKLINDLQRSIMMKRMLPSLITFGPIIFTFNTLREAYQFNKNVALNGNAACTSSCGVVTVLPFKVPTWIPVIGNWFSPYAANPELSVTGFGFWYFLTAITTSMVLQKIFGINLTGTQQQPMGPR
ncbi:MAG: DUF106 domain-containing protein [Candidatus Heimdallarchaeota archaeon]|nr:DUF106 domain-containing protein [Candidatus Heimdallarchaeota archaeon]